MKRWGGIPGHPSPPQHLRGFAGLKGTTILAPAGGVLPGNPIQARTVVPLYTLTTPSVSENIKGETPPKAVKAALLRRGGEEL